MEGLTKDEKSVLRQYSAIRGTFKRISDITGFTQEYIGGVLGINKSNVGYHDNKDRVLDLDPHTGQIDLVQLETIIKTGTLSREFKIKGVK
jgi:hypothetical protein